MNCANFSIFSSCALEYSTIFSCLGSRSNGAKTDDLLALLSISSSGSLLYYLSYTDAARLWSVKKWTTFFMMAGVVFPMATTARA